MGHKNKREIKIVNGGIVDKVRVVKREYNMRVIIGHCTHVWNCKINFASIAMIKGCDKKPT